MVLMAMDLPVDAYLPTGVTSSYTPPAIHQPFIRHQELEKRFILYQGTGGSIASFTDIVASGASTKIIPNSQNNLASAVNEICRSFGITKDELTQICNIQSRKTLYNWINGESTPRKSAMNKMFDLLLTARAWSSSGFAIDRAKLFHPVVNNESVFEMLKSEKIDRDLIMFAGTRLHYAPQQFESLVDPFA